MAMMHVWNTGAITAIVPFHLVSRIFVIAEA